MMSSEGWHLIDVASACFTQFVADNVDHNVRTVDDHATFHGMGIISASCSGPGIQALQQTRIPMLRAQLMTREACIGKGVPAVQFCRQSGAGLEKYIIKPLSNLDTLLTAQAIRSLNTLWHAAGVPLISGGQRPLWTGYMHSVCKGSHPLKSEVRMLLILGLNPSDMTSVKSVLAFVSKQAQVLNLPTTCITFDQPLYSKAIDIVLTENMNIVVRLGGFHTLMNFMGSVGYIMRG